MARFLLLSHDGAGLPLAYRLQEEGHEVSVWIQEATHHQQYHGLLPRLQDWKDGFGSDTVVLFDSVAVGISEKDKPEDEEDWSTYISIGDELRERGIPIIGGSSIADRMELDRTWGAAMAKEAGLLVPKATKFEDFTDALDFVSETKRRYILKPHGNQATFHLYPSENWRDMVAMLEHFQETFPPGPFELQEFVDGQQMCYTSDMEILMEGGWKAFQEVKVGDRAITLSPSTGIASYQPVTKVFCYPHDGEMVSVKTQMTSFCVTPNHRMWVRKIKDARCHNRQWKFVRANQLSTCVEWNYAKSAKWRGRFVKFYTIPSMKILDGRRGSHIAPPIRLPMTDWLKFLGWYISEGCALKHGGAYKVYISQKVHAKELEALLHRLPFKWHKERINYVFCSKQLHNLLAPLGHSHEKYVPEYVKRLPPALLQCFLDTYFLGDGHQKKGWSTKQYITVSKRLADDIQELCLKVGTSATIYCQNRRHPKWKDVYIISQRVTGNFGTIRKKNLKTTNYKGKVWCVQVEKNHIVYVRQHGKPMWSGNSIEGWWTGSQFVSVNSTFEHKPMLSGDLGPFTGETGSLIFYYPHRSTKLQRDVLDKLVPILTQYHYPPGPLDVNCILNEDGAHFLEFTARWGYPALYLQMYAIEGNLGDQLENLAEENFEGFQVKPDKWFLGSRVWIPKWPYGETEPTLRQAPLFERVKTAHLPHCSFVDVQAKQGTLVTGGTDGELLCVTVEGESIEEARGKLYALLHELYLYPMGWRSDLGVTALDNLPNLIRWGYWLPGER